MLPALAVLSPALRSSPRRFPFRLRLVEAVRTLPQVGHAHSLLVQPEAGVTPLVEAIESATTRIRCKMFSFTQPELLQALIDAHARGVDVKVMLNPARSDGSRANDESFERLRQAGVPIEWTNPRFMVTHEKTLVVDAKAYICTFNFCPKYFKKTRGFALVTDRRDEVSEVVECFEADWQRRPFQPRHLLISDSNARRRVIEFLASAQSSIDLQHPKLLDFTVVDRLVEALSRGVRVRFLSSGTRGIDADDALPNFAAMRILKRLGAEVHKVKTPRIHAKVILIDGVRVQMGSMNLTPHCFDVRREVGIFVDQSGVVRQLREVFEQDWNRSRPWNPPDTIDC